MTDGLWLTSVIGKDKRRWSMSVAVIGVGYLRGVCNSLQTIVL